MPSIVARVRRAVLGAPKDVKDPHAFHKLSLVALLAWIGLGADGLSSSAYGPDEAYRALVDVRGGSHTGLAIFLALATTLTVFIISYGYSRIIEQFPAGGGGYVVASKLLGPRIGVVSGAALLVDYVLTITVSISSGADAIWSFLPHAFLPYKLPFVFLGLAVLVLMNLRGVKESVTAIAPIFGVFVVTHAVLLIVTIGGHAADIGHAGAEVRGNVGETVRTLGTAGTLLLFVRAYSMGGGTYTGIEAVSNGLSIMREPRVQTAKRTMVLMATSLAITAGGILLCYLLVDLPATLPKDKTLNAYLLERVAAGWTVGGVHVGVGFVIAALLSEGALLFVAAQTGFFDGPRVMANMATDSWLPHAFSALSERLTMRNGVLLMGIAAALLLAYTHGNVSRLVVMYSINVFVTFSLSNIAMARFWIRRRHEDPTWARHLPAHVIAGLLCVTILGITIFEKFGEGGWLTLVITAALTAFCLVVKRHYGAVGRAIQRLDEDLPGPEASPEALAAYRGGNGAPLASEPDPEKPVAVIFVGGYGGLGRHATLTLLRMFPGHFAGVIFVSIAVVDSDTFKGASEVERLEQRTNDALDAYRRFASALGLPSSKAFALGTEVAVEAEKLGIALREKYPHALFVAGQIIFEEDTAWNRLLHNETAFTIQRRLQHVGAPMIVLPVQLDLAPPERLALRKSAEAST
ncbi:amino acid transporter-like protein [Minicystis rosea]|nr:amino acid transporter-like protein [Minicystis rosea]